MHNARHKPKGGANCPTRSLEIKWGDIKVVVATFNGCYWSIKDIDESGTTKDDVVMFTNINVERPLFLNIVGCC